MGGNCLVLLPTRYQHLPVLFSCKHGSSLEQLTHIQLSFCFLVDSVGRPEMAHRSWLDVKHH